MEKIKLSNNQELNITPMGIFNNTVTKRRTFNISSDLPYSDIEKLLIDPNNIGSIQYLSESGETLATYADCVGLKVLSKNIETGVYTAEFSTDVVEKKMAELQAQVDKLTAAQTVTA
jgi:hypothetical protein